MGNKIVKIEGVVDLDNAVDPQLEKILGCFSIGFIAEIIAVGGKIIHERMQY